jgi:hypothetical protein
MHILGGGGGGVKLWSFNFQSYCSPLYVLWLFLLPLVAGSLKGPGKRGIKFSVYSAWATKTHLCYKTKEHRWFTTEHMSHDTRSHDTWSHVTWYHCYLNIICFQVEDMGVGSKIQPVTNNNHIKVNEYRDYTQVSYIYFYNITLQFINNHLPRMFLDS